MKKFFAIAAMMLASVGAFAQYSAGDVTIQPKIGLNCSNLTDYSEDGDTDWKAGLAVGIEGEYHIKNWFGISAGLMYSQQGTKGEITNNKDAKLQMDYLNVPILANFYVAKGLALKAGIQPGFKVSSKVKYDGISIDADGVKSTDWSMPIGISYEYAGFVLDARYTLGITDAIKDVDAKNQVFQLTFGYKFKL